VRLKQRTPPLPPRQNSPDRPRPPWDLLAIIVAVQQLRRSPDGSVVERGNLCIAGAPVASPARLEAYLAYDPEHCVQQFMDDVRRAVGEVAAVLIADAAGMRAAAPSHRFDIQA
jgi:hypothetical protein